MKRVLFVFFYLISITVFSQNLVRNPNLEEYYHLPDLIYEYGERYQDSAFICKYWHKVKCTTPDYYHINAVHNRYGIPNNIMGYHPVISDSAYIGFIPFDLGGGSEPVSGEFSKPLEADSIYEISFYYRFSAISYFYLDKIECRISNRIDDLKNIRGQGVYDYDRIMTADILANVHFDTNLNNDGEWHKMSGTYKAIGGEKYITFGIFYQNDKLNKIINDYVGYNFQMGWNQNILERFYKKNSKYFPFIHRNPNYKLYGSDCEIIVDMDNESYNFKEHVSYYFIDNISVIKQKK